jgi:hypothetical protein
MRRFFLNVWFSREYEIDEAAVYLLDSELSPSTFYSLRKNYNSLGMEIYYNCSPAFRFCGYVYCFESLWATGSLVFYHYVIQSGFINNW